MSVQTQNRTQKLYAALFSMLLGISMGIFLNYILYRMSMPTKPFIYAWF